MSSRSPAIPFALFAMALDALSVGLIIPIVPQLVKSLAFSDPTFAPRALGIMQAAYEAASSYAANRTVFGSPIGDYQLTQAKLGRMAVIIAATRQSSYHVARLMAQGEGTLEASMLKAYVCRAAEWVTREAMQIHGGMGYAEEFPVSRYFVDARVLSIFEGADETLALKVIARRLIG